MNDEAIDKIGALFLYVLIAGLTEVGRQKAWLDLIFLDLMEAASL
jgi:hypothetical protein